jgi:D-alanine-D-alanine ligase
LPPATTAIVQAAGLAAHRALGCRHLSRTDLILREDGVPYVLEVNTIPGFTPTSLLPKAAACVQISYDELCERLVMMALADRTERLSTLTKSESIV